MLSKLFNSTGASTESLFPEQKRKAFSQWVVSGSGTVFILMNYMMTFCFFFLQGLLSCVLGRCSEPNIFVAVDMKAGQKCVPSLAELLRELSSTSSCPSNTKAEVLTEVG